jgi:hypothetical protein
VATGGAITVTHQPQHTIELAKGTNGVRPAQAKPVFATPAVVSYLVPAGTPPIPLTVEGVLAALPTLPLHHHPTAWSTMPFPDPQNPAGDRRVNGAAAERRRRALVRTAITAVQVDPADPTSGDASNNGNAAPPGTEITRVGIPSRLQLLVGGGAHRFVNASKPVEHDDRVELWNARLATRTDTQITPPIEFRHFVIADAVTSFPLSTLPQPPHGIPGTADAMWEQLIEDGNLTTVPSESSAEDIETQSRIDPLTMEFLHLIPIGGSTQLSGQWKTGDVKAYQHRVALGRDEKAKISTRGHLFPFGHRAVLSTTVVRRPDNGKNGSPIGLTSTSVLVVRQPQVFYFDADEAGRAWPWESVQITNPVSPPGDLGRSGDITF